MPSLSGPMATMMLLSFSPALSSRLAHSSPMADCCHLTRWILISELWRENIVNSVMPADLKGCYSLWFSFSSSIQCCQNCFLQSVSSSEGRNHLSHSALFMRIRHQKSLDIEVPHVPLCPPGQWHDSSFIHSFYYVRYQNNWLIAIPLNVS